MVAAGIRTENVSTGKELSVVSWFLPCSKHSRVRKHSTYLSSQPGLRSLCERTENKKGYSTAGALDTWCIDKESSISLLRSALKLYNLTNNKEYLDDAVAVSYYLSTWLWHYNGVYPENDNFTQYNYKTFGATSVSVQHHHLDPYALFWVPEWFELTKLTGDSQWKEKRLPSGITVAN